MSIGLLARYGMTRAAAGGSGTYRYYRAQVLTNNGDPDFVGILEFELRAYRGGPSLPLSLGGSSFASNDFYSAAGARAFDGLYTTGNGWATNNSGSFPQHVGWDFGSAVYVGQFVLSSHTTTTSTAARSVNNVDIQGSNDGSTWTTLVEVRGETAWTFAEKRLFTLVDCPDPADGIYTHYKFVVTANNGGALTGVSEFGLYATAGGSNLLTGATISGDFGAVLTSLVDGDTRTGLGAGAGGGTMSLVLASPAANPTLYRVGGHYTATDTAGRSPNAWRVERSFDEANFATWDSRSAQTGWVIDEVREFTP